MSKNKKPYLSVMIPTLNEAGNIKKMVDSIELMLSKNKYLGEIIIVDDNSEDGTAQIARDLNKKYKNIRVIVRNVRDGAGAAHVVGYKAAKGKIIIPIEGDCSCDINDIPKLVKKIEQGYDIVVASRYMSGGGNSKHTSIISYYGNKLISLFSGIQISDFTLSYKAFRREIMDKVKLVEKDGNPLLMEIILKANKAGFNRITEIPTRYTGFRAYGKSKNRFFRASILTFIAMIRITILGR